MHNKYAWTCGVDGPHWEKFMAMAGEILRWHEDMLEIEGKDA